MFIGKYISNCLIDNINDIKSAALYYDSIEILDNIVYTLTKPDSNGISTIRGIHNCIDNDFKLNLKILEDEKIVTYHEFQEKRFVPVENISYVTDPIDVELMDKCYQLMDVVGNQLFEIKKTNDVGLFRFLNKEVEKIHSSFINDLKIGSTIDMEFIYTYYSNMIYYILKYMYEGYNILTTSKVINNYFTKYYLKSILKDNNIKKYPSNNLAVMTIKYFVPNVSDLSFEDILKIRYKAKDELIAYRTYMDDMNNKITGDLSQSEVYEYTNNIIENKIQPSITDLQRKISSANIRVVHTFNIFIKTF
jgi:hypothetical protein